jgi:hypothetical protein
MASAMTSKNVGKLREPEARLLALRIAASLPGGEATTTQIKDRIPDYRGLVDADLLPSPTRPSEETWQQIVGNVVSHQRSRTSLFNQGFADRTVDGIRITPKGLEFLKAKGF